MATGIDIGSRFIKICRLNGKHAPILSPPRAHDGKPLITLREMWDELSPPPEEPVGLTGSAAGGVAGSTGLPVTDPTRATILGTKEKVPQVRNILDMGANSVSLLELTESGDLKDVSTNTMCAAGTGSFLDAQARRMGVGLEESLAFAPVADPPGIATRCAVFELTR